MGLLYPQYCKGAVHEQRDSAGAGSRRSLLTKPSIPPQPRQPNRGSHLHQVPNLSTPTYLNPLLLARKSWHSPYPVVQHRRQRLRPNPRHQAPNPRLRPPRQPHRAPRLDLRKTPRLDRQLPLDRRRNTNLGLHLPILHRRSNRQSQDLL